jgi:uncharacterized protein YcnI
VKKIVASTFAAAAIILSPSVALAHVVVKPAQVATASFQTFTTGVPNEKDIEVTSLRLVIPAGLNYVSPTVKPGWTIETKKDGDNVTEITWSGGAIPAGQRDDFTFGAQAPAKTTTLAWKAYESYADGTTVAWDQKPDGKDSEDSSPYSETKVVNDLAPAKTDTPKADTNNANLGVALGTIGIVLGAAAIVIKRS